MMLERVSHVQRVGFTGGFTVHCVKSGYMYFVCLMHDKVLYVPQLI